MTLPASLFLLDTDEIEGDIQQNIHHSLLKSSSSFCTVERSGSYVDRNPLQANNAPLNGKKFCNTQIESCV